MTEKLLNELYGPFLAKKHFPFQVNLGDDAVTLFNNDDQAFTLASAITGNTRFNPKTKFETTADGGVIRTILPLAVAATMTSDFMLGMFYISIMKNAMLLKMAEKFNLDEYYHTFVRPGKPNEYFRDTDTVAGYELRLYLDKSVDKFTGVKKCK